MTARISQNAKGMATAATTISNRPGSANMELTLAITEDTVVVGIVNIVLFFLRPLSYYSHSSTIIKTSHKAKNKPNTAKPKLLGNAEKNKEKELSAIIVGISL